MNTNENNKQYCVWCGALGDKRSTLCTRCGKKMDPDENLLIDYLVSRTKSKFKSKAVNTVYDALKGYLLSHLYGVVLVISVIAVYATDYITGMPGVQLVSQPPEYISEYINNDRPSEIPVTPTAPPVIENRETLSEDDMYAAIENMIYAVVSGDTATLESLYLPDSYGYTSTHQMTKSHMESVAGQTINADTLHFHSPYRISYANEYLVRDDAGNIIHGLEPKAITKQLTDDGFITNEMVFTVIYYDESEEEYGWARYITTMVFADGKWYTAGEEFYNLTFARL